MSDDEMTQWLNQIGRLIAEVGNSPRSTLLYVQIGPGWVSPALFQDRGNHIFYEESLDLLADPLLEFWYSQQPGNPWAELHYVVRGGKFDAAFIYPDEIDPEEDPFERRDRIVAKYLGEKPIMYPPPDEANTFNL